MNRWARAAARKENASRKVFFDTTAGSCHDSGDAPAATAVTAPSGFEVSDFPPTAAAVTGESDPAGSSSIPWQPTLPPRRPRVSQAIELD